MQERVLKFKSFSVNENYQRLDINTYGKDYDEISGQVELSEAEFIAMFDGSTVLNEKKGDSWFEGITKKLAMRYNIINKDIPEIKPKWTKDVEEFFKTPAMVKDKETGKKKKGSNGGRGNHFRRWVNEKHPEWAKKNNFDSKGNYKNSYMKKAWSEFGIEYIRLYVRSKKIEQEKKRSALKLAREIGMKTTAPNYGVTSDGNTVTGGLFDLNDRKTYEAVKDVKNMVINGVKYTCVKFGEGIKSIGEFTKKTAVAAGDFLLKIAEFTGKTIVFTAAGIYVLADATVKGMVSLASSIWGYTKKGAIVVGNTLAAAFRNVNEFFVKVGGKISGSLKAAGNFATDVCEKIMNGLYTVANKAKEGAQAFAALTVAAYNKTKKFFGDVADFAKKCIYDAAIKVKQTAIKIGTGIKEFYNTSMDYIKDKAASVKKWFMSGYQKAKNFMATAYNKSKSYVKKVKNKVVKTAKKIQRKIVQTGKEIYSQGVAFVKGIFSSNEYQDGGISVFESYVEFNNGERFYIPLGEKEYNYNTDLV